MKDTIVARDKQHLVHIIEEHIKKYGVKCNLNNIDVSNINDMSFLFSGSQFNGDISNQDVSNVKDMENMFSYGFFNGDISKRNVGNVEDMESMFQYSLFKGDIGSGNINKKCNKFKMFNVKKYHLKKLDIKKISFINTNIFQKLHTYGKYTTLFKKYLQGKIL